MKTALKRRASTMVYHAVCWVRMALPAARLGLMLLAGLSMMSALGACSYFSRQSAQKFQLTPGAATPSTTGVVKVTPTKEDNKKLHIEVQHMPPPERLSPSLTTFVVWGEPRGSQDRPINMGQLLVDESRQASLVTVTPYTRLEILVTAEETPTPEKPSQYTILKGQVLAAPAAK